MGYIDIHHWEWRRRLNLLIDFPALRSLPHLTNVVAVVSGGASGIGLMVSLTLIANGAKVYIIGPKQADLDRIAQLYNAEAEKIPGGGKIIGIEGDISVKCISICLGVLRFYSHEDFTNVLNTNAVGHYWMSFAFLPFLEKWKNSEEQLTKKFAPQVIMTSSMNGWTKDSATSGLSYPYMFSKSAIGHAISSLAHELLPLGIRVNGIAPGLFPSGVQAEDSRFQVPAMSTGGTRRDVGALASG
ncbi:short chain dehydrogenase reductase family [Moniliophthora roreri]|nr:short chain dehydrogenase reductase family [Moniliophthora roreri]